MSEPVTTKQKTTKFVVYLDKIGRTPRGSIVRCQDVKVAGDTAYVRRGSARTADMLPAMNVFETQADAERFLASGGELRWVVTSHDKGEEGTVPTLFKGRVKMHTYVGRYCSEYSKYAVCKTNGERVDVDRYRTEFFNLDQELDAREAYKNLWDRLDSEARAQYESGKARMAMLKACSPAKLKPLKSTKPGATPKRVAEKVAAVKAALKADKKKR